MQSVFAINLTLHLTKILWQWLDWYIPFLLHILQELKCIIILGKLYVELDFFCIKVIDASLKRGMIWLSVCVFISQSGHECRVSLGKLICEHHYNLFTHNKNNPFPSLHRSPDIISVSSEQYCTCPSLCIARRWYDISSLLDKHWSCKMNRWVIRLPYNLYCLYLCKPRKEYVVVKYETMWRKQADGEGEAEY